MAIRAVWNSTPNSGNCTGTELASKLDSCSIYKCDFINNIFPMIELEQAVLGNYEERCYFLSQSSFNSELTQETYCAYNDSQRTRMVNYMIFSDEHCGDGVCSFTYNQTGSFIDGIPIDNIQQEMMTDGSCGITNFNNTA